jgi:hypothetical protein
MKSSVTLPLHDRDTELHSVTNRDISFDFAKLKWKGIDREDLSRWEKLYPNADIPSEMRNMVRWLDRMIISRNPLKINKKAQKKNWRIFITKWLTRADEKGAWI